MQSRQLHSTNSVFVTTYNVWAQIYSLHFFSATLSTLEIPSPGHLRLKSYSYRNPHLRKIQIAYKWVGICMFLAKNLDKYLMLHKMTLKCN